VAEPAVDLVPELGPEIEVTARAAPRVGLVAILAVTLGIILSVEAVVRGFFGTASGAVGWIPYLGGVLTEPITKIEQKLISFLSGLENDVDKALAHNIHVAAALFDKLWHSLEYMAATIVLLGALSTAAVFHYLIHPLEQFVHTAIRRVEGLFLHPLRTLENIVTAIRHEVSHVVEPAIKRATVAVPRFLHKDLHAINKELARVQKTATQALHEAAIIPSSPSITTWADAVAAALPALGLQWLTSDCNPFTKTNKPCSIWNALKDLFGLFTGLFAFTVFCDFWSTVEPFIGDILAPVIGIASTFANGACSQRPDTWQTFGITLDLPTQIEITNAVTLT
jgi:hypothetical protein